jgi:hypothetical protein
MFDFILNIRFYLESKVKCENYNIVSNFYSLVILHRRDSDLCFLHSGCTQIILIQSQAITFSASRSKFKFHRIAVLSALAVTIVLPSGLKLTL